MGSSMVFFMGVLGDNVAKNGQGIGLGIKGNGYPNTHGKWYSIERHSASMGKKSIESPMGDVSWGFWHDI